MLLLSQIYFCDLDKKARKAIQNPASPAPQPELMTNEIDDEDERVMRKRLRRRLESQIQGMSI